MLQSVDSFSVNRNVWNDSPLLVVKVTAQSSTSGNNFGTTPLSHRMVWTCDSFDILIMTSMTHKPLHEQNLKSFELEYYSVGNVAALFKISNSSVFIFLFFVLKSNTIYNFLLNVQNEHFSPPCNLIKIKILDTTAAGTKFKIWIWMLLCR